ncbi:Uncharacterized conserved protein [Mycoplasmopsis californica]|uniref:MupG family TIM beta-alpha barrel fold protein n=1 Tax=Mycoplasmopsis equigenitalium TaxID=114883 RepID=A0ABY5J057_9BACT|nr:MupG family TIM beta-alpha barrel fold protein [Mycoplasmopsis equigenitalium]UUD36661.1 MupG family TIM beta-alpha barrel fold protein [Mycoplasmopsis equigenitalium]VEU69377.1 Uncharacterized conserved protein [Mycoplasmopsis californica]
MLGISIYPDKQDKKEIINYIKLAARYNFKRIFSCLLSINKEAKIIKEEFLEINELAKKLGMMVILDVNPRVFEQLGISYKDLSFFKEIKADGVRLDLGFNGLTEADMTYNKEDLFIEINMSLDSKYIDNILSCRPNIKKLIACHNFYPQRYTGLSLPFFENSSKKCKDFHMRTAAFVNSSGAVGPWPLSHGLPTLEMHRDLNIKVQAKHLFATGLIDDVIIGNAFASEKELKALSSINSDLICFTLTKSSLKNTTNLEKEILFKNNHFRRPDTNAYTIRSTQSRVKYKENDFPAHDTPPVLKRGDVVICNNNLKQYKGELQIVLSEHKNIEMGKNVVGKIDPDEMILLDYVLPIGKFTFEE